MEITTSGTLKGYTFWVEALIVFTPNFISMDVCILTILKDKYLFHLAQRQICFLNRIIETTSPSGANVGHICEQLLLNKILELPKFEGPLFWCKLTACTEPTGSLQHPKEIWETKGNVGTWSSCCWLYYERQSPLPLTQECHVFFPYPWNPAC